MAQRSAFDLRGAPDPKRVLALLLAGAILVAFAWLAGRQGDARAVAAECAAGYDAARSDEDTARVDAEIPVSAASALATCGALRQSGRISRRP